MWNLSYEDCLNRAGTCHILAIVAKRRLRFWQKCGGTLDVVPHARCWANAVVKDLLWFHLSSGKTSSLPSPDVEWEEWGRFVARWPLWFQEVLNVWSPNCCPFVCLDRLVKRPQFGIACAECNFVCASPAGLAAHMRKKHCKRSPIWFYVHGSLCPVCGCDFHFRGRVVQHLRHGSRQCRDAYLSGSLSPHDETEECRLQILDKRWCQLALKHGRHPYAFGGPVRPSVPAA